MPKVDIKLPARPKKLMIATFSESTDEIAWAFKLAGKLLNENIPTEVYIGTRRLKGQLKYADKKGIKAVLIRGEDEQKAGKVQYRPLSKAGHRWEEEKIKILIPEDELILQVKRLLLS